MRSAMFRLDPTTGTFTSTHLRFIQLCMETRSYKAALPVLNNYIHSLPTAIAKETLEDLEHSVVAADSVASGEFINLKSGHTGKITLTDLQEYYILGAMAYIGERQVHNALHFLEHVLVTPANNALNGLMLEAYKKWVLISCLADKSVSACATTIGMGFESRYDRLEHRQLTNGSTRRLRGQ
jgi:COP9 signalosome complex subunit 3